MKHLSDLTFDAHYEQALRAAGIDSVDTLFALPTEIDLSKSGLDSWRERVQVEIEVDGQKRTFFVKRYRNAPHSARRNVRRSGCGARSLAGIEWMWLLRFREENIPCPKPVVLAEEFHNNRETRSALMMAAVPGESLERLCGTAGALESALVDELLEEAADLVAKLHGRGYVHRDLYLSHIFCDPSACRGERLSLIDLQRIMRPDYNVARWIVKDLAALNYSTPQRWVCLKARLRFLRRYLQASGLVLPYRRLIYRIVGKTQAIARHDVRRMRRLSNSRMAGASTDPAC